MVTTTTSAGGEGFRDLHPLERELSGQLRRVRLVAEIGIDERLRSELAAGLSSILRRVTADPNRISRLYPAILVCYMVAEGIYGYEAGGYFSHQTVHRVDQSFAKPTLAALRQLGLEDFGDLVAQENAKPYLTPILAHGGIPKYCLADFFALLLHDLGRGLTDANDLLMLWRTRKTRFQGIDKPAERFLLYGGELAVDLIDRCVDLVREYSRTGAVPSAHDIGLPPYVVEAFVELPQKEPSSVRAQAALPRPHLTIDPWDPQGPTLELPALPSSVKNGEWFVQDSDRPIRYAAARGEPSIVLLRPSRSWACELHTDGVLARRSNFRGLRPSSCDVLRSSGWPGGQRGNRLARPGRLDSQPGRNGDHWYRRQRPHQRTSLDEGGAPTTGWGMERIQPRTGRSQGNRSANRRSRWCRQ